MRSIKFRAWDSDEKVMLVDWRECYDWTINRAFSDTEYKIMQYTGLKDRNGKEIYEGDIIERQEYPYYNNGLRNYLSVVDWFDEDACWYANIYAVSDRVVGSACGGILGEYSDWEVIGNIYENGDLLNEQKP